MNKESKWSQYYITGNIFSYYIILNIENNLEMVQYCKELAVSIAMLNAEKGAKDKAVTKKKAEEEKENEKKKAGKEFDKVNNRNELLPGFEQDTQHRDVNRIITLIDKHMRY